MLVCFVVFPFSQHDSHMNVQVSPGLQITNTLFSYFLLIITKQSLLCVYIVPTYFLFTVCGYSLLDFGM